LQAYPVRIKFLAMKHLTALFILICTFSSCAPTNRIVVIKDSHSDSKGFKLVQNLKTTSSAKTGKAIVNQYFDTEATYLFEERNDQKPVVSLQLSATKAIRADMLDSLMVLNLDREKISVAAIENEQKLPARVPAVTDRNQIQPRKFSIPENLWLSIAHSKAISYSLSIGKTQIGIKLNPEEITKVNAFFRRAMQRRLEIVPLVPPGKVKW